MVLAVLVEFTLSADARGADTEMPVDRKAEAFPWKQDTIKKIKLPRMSRNSRLRSAA